MNCLACNDTKDSCHDKYEGFNEHLHYTNINKKFNRKQFKDG